MFAVGMLQVRICFGKRTKKRNWALFFHLSEWTEESHEKSQPTPFSNNFWCIKILMFWGHDVVQVVLCVPTFMGSFLASYSVIPPYRNHFFRNFGQYCNEKCVLQGQEYKWQ